MAKHRHRNQDNNENTKTNNNSNMNNMNNMNNNPFGIDPLQLMSLLGGNFDVSNMSNMLSSMNTNGFNLGNLAPLAQMAGLNLDNNFVNNMNNNATNNHPNNNMASNVNGASNANSKNTNNTNNSSSNLNTIKNYPNKEGSMKEKITKESKEPTLNNNVIKDDLKKQNVIRKIDSNLNKDSNLEFLMFLRTYANQDKVTFIDKIIKLYNSGAFKEM